MIYFIVHTNLFRIIGIGILVFRRLHYFSNQTQQTFSLELELRSVAGEVRRNKHYIFVVGEMILNKANKC